MDPMDEFEFRPLSQGLGFHDERKTEAVLDKVAADHVLRKPKVPTAPDSKKKPDLKLPKFQRPDLDFNDSPKKDERAKDKSLFSNEPESSERESNREAMRKAGQKLVEESAALLEQFEKRALETEAGPQKATSQRLETRTQITTRLQRTSFSFEAWILDSIFVLAMTLIFMIAVLQVTQVDLLSVLFSFQADMMPKLAVGVMFASLFINYLIVCRSFFSCSLGEWAFDIQLGNSKQIASGVYPLIVVGRVALIGFTGFLILPLLSMIFGRDIAGDITGLHLYRRSVEL